MVRRSGADRLVCAAPIHLADDLLMSWAAVSEAVWYSVRRDDARPDRITLALAYAPWGGLSNPAILVGDGVRPCRASWVWVSPVTDHPKRTWTWRLFIPAWLVLQFVCLYVALTLFVNFFSEYGFTSWHDSAALSAVGATALLVLALVGGTYLPWRAFLKHERRVRSLQQTISTKREP